MRIIDKYKKITVEKKAFIWFTICNFIQKAISFILVPIFTRLMSTTEYGTYSVYQSWYMIVSIFTTFNLCSGVYNKGLVKFNRDDFTLSMMVFSNIITSVWFILYLCSSSFWQRVSELNSILIISMFVDFYFGISIQFWSARQRFEYKYKSMVILTLIVMIVSSIISVAAVLQFSNKANARIVSMVVVNAAFGIMFYASFLYNGKLTEFVNYCKYAVRFNLPLIPHYLSMIVLQQSDRIFIAKMAGEEKAAIYSIAYSVSTIMMFVINALTSAFTPFVYTSLEEKKISRLSDVASKLLELVAAINFFVVLFGPEVIRFFAPPQYYEAIWVIPPVATSIFFMFFYNIFTIVEFHYEKTIFVMLASVIGAVLNVILNYVCIMKFGYIAAAYTTLICYILFAIAHFYFANKVLALYGHKKVFDSRFIILLSLIIIVMMFAVLPLYNNVIVRYSAIIIGIVLLIANKKKIIQLIKDIKRKD